MTIKLLREVKPDYMAFCFDRGEPSFRSEIYADYKAHRSEMPDDLKPQVPFVRELTVVLGIPALDYPGFEADDVIGSLVHFGRRHSLEVVIVSSDKDFAQLVGPFVTMYDTMKDIRYDEDGVVAKWGVRPEQIIDYLALIGDASDNIPGVKGVGPKGAEKLLAQFKTLEGIYQNLDQISGKSLKEKLIADRENAFLAKKLVTITTDLPVVSSLEELSLRPMDQGPLRALLQKLEFKTLEKKLLDGGKDPERKTETTESEPPRKASPKATRASLEISEESWDLAQIQKEIEPYSTLWAIVTERGLFLAQDRRVIRPEVGGAKLGVVLKNKNLNWKGFDVKEVWKDLKVDHQIAAWDQMLAAYVLRAQAVDDFATVYETHCEQKLPELASFAQIYQAHLELEQVLKEKLKAFGGEKVLETLELPLVPLLCEMETTGILVNRALLSEQSRELAYELSSLEKRIFTLAGTPFNIGSPKQLGSILFEKLKLPSGKRTKTGFSTDADVLEKLSGEYEICRHILEYREVAKLKSTYVDALPQLLDANDRVHTHFRQAATATGRLSSVNPNLQNIPIRTERGRLIRKAFIAPEDHLLIAADYSQIELRILAHITDDPALCQAFQENLDVHTATAAEVFSVPLSEVTAEQRRRAKAVNFGIAYGQGAFGLSESLRISRGEASEIIERYFQRYKRVREYMSDTVATATRLGFVETMFGRRRYIDELKSKNGAIRKFGERAAINAPMQGSASDLVKLSMIKLYWEKSIPLLLQVHDELLFESPKHSAARHSQQIKTIMENVTRLRVPLIVNVATGTNWEDAHG